MSTRAIVNFYDTYDGTNRDEKGRFTTRKHLRAKVYRHGDGYPEGLGKDLREFLDLLKKTVKDNRFNDASYLAAKWVVHDAARMAGYSNYNSKTGEYDPPTSPLNFLSVGIMMEDPGDIEYIYDVVCTSSWNSTKTEMPTITHRRA